MPEFDEIIMRRMEEQMMAQMRRRAMDAQNRIFQRFINIAEPLPPCVEETAEEE